MCGYRGCCWASICSHGSIMFPLMELHLTLMDPTVLFEQTTESTPEKLDSLTNRLPVNDFSSPLKSPVELDPKALPLLRVEETYSLEEPLSTME
ncbi:hypothetical protein CDAR_213371 [Caerostris darwini]|uniref:Uncharacterized protein n=1 Tax=Caerostris darwini TaxID=1538125 RepID=A0AAV4PVZ2_9ARAC|nr:hypothetical protein CDAR_213371 [Caerostris darwini]